MKLYLDEDVSDPLLASLLTRAGHDVQMPKEAGLLEMDDVIQLTHAIEEQRICVTGNHDDFLNLHNLIMRAQGHHPGIFAIRRDNDPRRDLTPRGIVRAIQNIDNAGIELADDFHVLNHWR